MRDTFSITQRVNKVTKNLQDFFNVPPSLPTDIEEQISVETKKTKDQLMVEANDIYNSLSTVEKVDNALPLVVGLESHENEMDEIAKKAITTFNDLVALGGNVPDIHAGKIFEVAGQMLKTALDAKNSKADKKLKMIELQLKKLRAEQTDPDPDSGGKGGKGGEFDRNELLKYIIDSKEKTK